MHLPSNSQLLAIKAIRVLSSYGVASSQLTRVMSREHLLLIYASSLLLRIAELFLENHVAALHRTWVRMLDRRLQEVALDTLDFMLLASLGNSRLFCLLYRVQMGHTAHGLLQPKLTNCKLAEPCTARLLHYQSVSYQQGAERVQVAALCVTRHSQNG